MACVAEPGQKLTRCEMQTVREVVTGKTDREIAAVLCVSYETVRDYTRAALAKTGLKNRVQLAVWAVRLGYDL